MLQGWRRSTRVDLLSPALHRVCRLQLGCKVCGCCLEWSKVLATLPLGTVTPSTAIAVEVLLEQAGASGLTPPAAEHSKTPVSRHGRPHLDLAKHCGQRAHSCAGGGPVTAAPHQVGGLWLQENGTPLRNGSLEAWSCDKCLWPCAAADAFRPDPKEMHVGFVHRQEYVVKSLSAGLLPDVEEATLYAHS